MPSNAADRTSARHVCEMASRYAPTISAYSRTGTRPAIEDDIVGPRYTANPLMSFLNLLTAQSCHLLQPKARQFVSWRIAG